MKANRIKTAVKAGEMTPEEALAKISEWDKDTPYITPHRTVGWLKRRAK